MPREKLFIKLIPRIYKCNAENIGLFFFIKALRQAFPSLSIEQGINMFRKFAQISEDDWDTESMHTTFHRMQNDYYNNLKSGCTEKDKGDTGTETGLDKPEYTSAE